LEEKLKVAMIMTTDSFINENRTETFKKGDRVLMHSCGEADIPKYKGKIWTCETDSYLDRGRKDVVFLEGFSGCFSTKYLQIVRL
jgi:G:T-mismatch repair DNA endonuclease (very short patch repair protein)